MYRSRAGPGPAITKVPRVREWQVIGIVGACPIKKSGSVYEYVMRITRIRDRRAHADKRVNLNALRIRQNAIRYLNGHAIGPLLTLSRPNVHVSTRRAGRCHLDEGGTG